MSEQRNKINPILKFTAIIITALMFVALPFLGSALAGCCINYVLVNYASMDWKLSALAVIAILLGIELVIVPAKTIINEIMHKITNKKQSDNSSRC